MSASIHSLTCDGWLSRSIAGIRPCEDDPGFARVVIRPALPARLAWAEGSLDTHQFTLRGNP
jgi:hypothetical protein